jgi:hypothetical protein
MTPTSRTPRPRVVEEKISAPANRGSSELSPVEIADCLALQGAYERANAGRRGRERISDRDLATAARALGGSAHRQQWWRYRNGKSPMPFIDLMVAAMVFDERPQDLFPSWKFSALTPFQPSGRAPQLARQISGLAEPDRTALLFIIDAFLEGKKAARDALLRCARRLFKKRGS